MHGKLNSLGLGLGAWDLNGSAEELLQPPEPWEAAAKHPDESIDFAVELLLGAVTGSRQVKGPEALSRNP